MFAAAGSTSNDPGFFKHTKKGAGMDSKIGIALATVLIAGAAATAEPTLQMDVNNVHFQVTDGTANSAFGGTSHTGSVLLNFDADFTRLVDIAVRDGISGPGTSLGAGTLADFDGVIDLVGGSVTGGNLTVTLDSGDTYTAQIGNAGGVSNFVGGGYTIDGLTFDGAFSDATFGSADVTDWFAAQGGPMALVGSFLTFAFDPTVGGDGYADMDLFVVVPLPPAGWAGMATLAGVMGLGYIRRRRSLA